MRASRRPRSRGQALVEMVLILPVLVMLMLGAADLGRAFYLNIEVAGASRAGMRTGVITASNDVGNAVRREAYNAIDNSAAVWGTTGPSGTYDGCNKPTGPCGDPTGCAPGAFQGTQLACFAVRTCHIQGAACASYDAWGSRAAAGTFDQAVQVRVVYKFTPVTPLVASLTGTNGVFYLTSDATALELY